MPIIKTAKYLVGTTPVSPGQGSKSKLQLAYATLEEFVEKEGFIETEPHKYKLSEKAFKKIRSGFPDTVRHIFLHHTATSRSSLNKNIVEIFNKRSYEGNSASSHRGINYLGEVEKYMPDDYKANCQGASGYNFNTSGMSVEIIALGFLINEPLTKDLKGNDLDGIYYKQSSEHGKKYWVKESETALAVDFNGNPKAYKGYERWNAYTQAQVDATIDLIKEWGVKYTIPFVFNSDAFDKMFPPSQIRDIVKDRPGVYSHCAIKNVKRDIYPDPLLVKALKENFGENVASNPLKDIELVPNTNSGKSKGVRKDGFIQGIPSTKEAIEGEYYQNYNTLQKYQFIGGKYVEVT